MGPPSPAAARVYTMEGETLQECLSQVSEYLSFGLVGFSSRFSYFIYQRHKFLNIISHHFTGQNLVQIIVASSVPEEKLLTNTA